MILTKSNIKEINLELFVDSLVKSGKLNEILFIVPTNRKIRYLKRELIIFSPLHAAGGINIETIGSFSIKIFSGPEGNKCLVREESAIVLLKRSFRDAKLKYFSNYNGDIPFGTLERIKNVISEYKRHGISPENLMMESEKLSGTEKIKAEDIANIYKIYRNKFVDFGVMEIGDVYGALNKINNKNYSDNFKEYFPDVITIIINGFDEFTIPEIEILNSSADLDNVDLYLYFDYYKYNPLVFSHLDKCFNKLEGKGFNVIKDLSIVEQTKFIENVKQKLFSSKKADKTARFKSKITEITAFNRENEIALIAKEIKKIIVEKKVEPNKLCVAFNLIKPYSTIIRDQFNSYGIPFNLTDRFSLSTSSPIISIINLLEILENDFYYKNIFRSLNSNIIEIADVDLSNLLQASVELKIISGLKNWKDRLNDAIIEQHYGEESFDEMKRYNVNYEKALSDIEMIHSILKPFENGMTLNSFYKNIRSMIYNLSMHTKILNGSEDTIEKDIKALTTFILSMKELVDLLKSEYGTEKKFPLKFFLSELRTIASFSRFNIKEKPGYGVLVTTLNEIRGLQFDYLFIAGLTDGDFPTRFAPEIFFSGSFLKQELKHQTEERYHFYQALCSWKKGLYLTRPQTDDRKDLVESNFLLEFKNTFEISEKTAEDYNSTVFSQYELLEYTGKVIGRNETEISIPCNESFNLERIKDAIKINHLRINKPFAGSSYSGILTDDLSEELKDELLMYNDKQYSVTQLESYAKCPYQYFVERVLHLNTIEEPTEEIEAFELGSLLHLILYKFYTELRNKGIVLQQCNDKDFTDAEKLLFAIASVTTDKLNLNSALTFYEKEKILGIGDDKKNSILYKFLINERSNTDGFIPEYFELKFGKVEKLSGDNPFAEEEFKIGNVKVRGKIDRVDINENEKTIKLVDYKLSGKKPTQNDLLTGLSLQLPLYLYAAKELINAQLNKDFKPYGSEIYSLKFNKNDFGPKLIKIGRERGNEKNNMVPMAEEMINICVESINKFVGKITQGIFNLSTLEDRENKVCKYCNFRSICRIQEIN
ncbi:MAG: PD-(D/E)XK nuclease family protein [Ignavibacteria bacterium]|nr:PD-(D/E)XK nuclease family protein [Ignavibacteria bacterium]